uniref:Uncharacterized protein n=1 Tax=Strongyloides stercoralis TaxID=6248 RepID=A0AAF5DCS4_STRER
MNSPILLNISQESLQIKGENIMEISPTTILSNNSRTLNNVNRETIGIHDIQFSGYTVFKTNDNNLTITLLNITPDPRGYRMSVDEVKKDGMVDLFDESNISVQREYKLKADDYVLSLLSILPKEIIEKVTSESRRSASIKLYKIYYFLRDLNNHIITARAFAETVSLFFNLTPPILRKDIPNYLRPHVVDSLRETKEELFSLIEGESEKVKAAFEYFFP